MGIKNRIKLSFLIIIILVLTVGTLSIAILYQVKKNNFVKDKISQIILVQERMNEAIEAQGNAKDKASTDSIQKDFISHEKSFEALKEEIPLNHTFSFLDTLSNKKEEKLIITQLEKLFENEHKIESTFESMHKLQERFIKLHATFEKLYPQENTLRKKLEQNTRTFLNDLHVIRIFGQVQYYSKETLYQHQNQASLDKWLSYTQELHERMNNDVTSKKYLEAVNQIGSVAIHIKNTASQKEKLLQDIHKVLKENKQIEVSIAQTIEALSSSTTNRAFVLLFLLTAGLIGFLTFIAYVVTKKVGLSVDEIETKVHEGIEEIQHLNQEISDTQKEVIFTMGAIGEQRSKETGNHVKRVAQYSQILALHYGLSEEEAQMLKQASPMHDIGKVAIPDAILNKPGKFEPHEREIMEKHANLGFEMLKNSHRPLLKMAAIIANEHHEKWDGSGYPQGLSGENIHIYGRITALADVFDALGSDRVYKEAWDNEKIFALFKKERGKHFDPKLVDIFFENLDEFLSVQEKFKDAPPI